MRHYIATDGIACGKGVGDPTLEVVRAWDAVDCPECMQACPTAEEYIRSMVATLHEHRPELLRPLQGAWKGPEADPATPAGIFWWVRSHLLVFVSPWNAADGTLWLHASVSRRDRCPTYDELTEVRGHLFRPSDTVLHVWPPADEHFSFHPYCLHLWTPMDGSRPIPDLRGDGGGA